LEAQSLQSVRSPPNSGQRAERALLQPDTSTTVEVCILEQMGSSKSSGSYFQRCSQCASFISLCCVHAWTQAQRGQSSILSQALSTA